MTGDAYNRLNLSFPWTSAAGLARVLDDPALWTDVFTASIFRGPLEASLRRVMRTRALPRSLSDRDDLGAMLCEVLRRPHLRTAVHEDLQAHAPTEYAEEVSLSVLLGMALLMHLPTDRRFGPPLPPLLDTAFRRQFVAPRQDDFSRLLLALPAATPPSFAPLLAACLALTHRALAADYADTLLAAVPDAIVAIAAMPAAISLAPAESNLKDKKPRPPKAPPLQLVARADISTAPSVSPPARALPAPPSAPPQALAFVSAPVTPQPVACEPEATRTAALCTALAHSDVGGAAACLTGETLAAAWAVLCRPPGDEPARAVHACLAGDLDGLLFALWQLDEPAALAVCMRLPAEQRRAVLAGCNFAMLQQVAGIGGEFAGVAGELLLAAALQAEEAESLEYIDPCLSCLPEVCVQFLVAARLVGRRGDLGASLRALVVDTEATSDPIRDDSLGRRIRDIVTTLPGMSGHFHRLRMTAHRLFIAPLQPYVVDGRVDLAIAQWADHGTIEDKLAVCSLEQPDGVRRGLDPIHLEKTRQYLRYFDELLRTWASGLARRPEIAAGASDLADAWDQLHRDRTHHASSMALVRVVEAWSDGSFGKAYPPEVGRRWTTQDARPIRMGTASIPPVRLESWKMRSAGRSVSLAVFVADGVRHALGKAPRTLAEVVECLVAEKLFRAAREAAEDTQLAARVEAAAADAVAALRHNYAGALRAAEAERTPGDEIDEILERIGESLDALEYDDAELELMTLDNVIRHARLRRDPTRGPAVRFLRALGLDTSDDELGEVLRARVREQREQHIDRRWHIIALDHAAGDTLLPEAIRHGARSLADDLDQPGEWPTQGVAQAVHDDLESLFRYIRGQTIGDWSPDVKTLVVTVPERIRPLVRTAIEAGDRTLAAVSSSIREHMAIAQVLLRLDPRLGAAHGGVLARAHALYREGQWQVARNLLAVVPVGDRADNLLRACVELSHRLWSVSPLDVSWGAVQGHARWIAERAASASPLAGQAARLADLAAELACIRESRIVDFLLRSDLPAEHRTRSAEAALLLLELQLQAARRGRGAAEAVNTALSLPEQIFRGWARWVFGLDFSCVPPGQGHLWRVVARESRIAGFRPPPPNGPFPSFHCFALFVQAWQLHAVPDAGVATLEHSFGDLQRSLRFLRMRNDSAHASFRPTEDQRRGFFALIERWLGCLYDACSARQGSHLRTELQQLLEPLVIDGG